MAGTVSPIEGLSLIGGALCLDFTNTVGNHNTAEPQEYLRTYGDLVAWGRHAGIVESRAVPRLLAEATRHPDEAGAVLARALALREALYRIFSAAAAGSQPAPGDLALLNKTLAEAMAHAHLVSTGSGFDWEWEKRDAALDHALYPLARSAAELLTSGDWRRVRECASDRCGWLFVDTSRNHSRRWCAMNDCGNRAKARRHYRRVRRAR